MDTWSDISIETAQKLRTQLNYQKRQYDLRLEENHYEVGDFVYRLNGASAHQQSQMVNNQKILLRAACQESVMLGKPLVIHCWDAVRSKAASHNCIELVRSIVQPETRIYLHCFSQSLGVAYQWSQRFHEVYLGISPIILWSPPAGMEEVVYQTSPDRLLLETDFPCLGTSPAQLYHVADKVRVWKKNQSSLEEVLLKAQQATVAFYHL